MCVTVCLCMWYRSCRGLVLVLIASKLKACNFEGYETSCRLKEMKESSDVCDQDETRPDSKGSSCGGSPTVHLCYVVIWALPFFPSQGDRPYDMRHRLQTCGCWQMDGLVRISRVKMPRDILHKHVVVGEVRRGNGSTKAEARHWQVLLVSPCLCSEAPTG
jgi:hypothetical protein